MQHATALQAAFFDRPAQTVAQDLLGRLLIHDTPVTAGIIVETEAYDQHDAASHSFIGQTPRNQQMFAAPGTCYVYRSYGVHWCINAVTGEQNYGAAVLIRAIAPTVGLAHMRQRRQPNAKRQLQERDLCRGPGRLCQALGITIANNGSSLLDSPLRILTPANFQPPEIRATKRIGISKEVDRLWRFIIPNNRFVSGSRKQNGDSAR